MSSPGAPPPPPANSTPQLSTVSPAATTPAPERWVALTISLRASDASALMGNLAFVCALRHGLSLLTAVPLRFVRVVSAATAGGAPFPVLVSQQAGDCSVRRLPEAAVFAFRRAQAVAPVVDIQCSVDAGKSALPGAAGDAAAAVQSHFESMMRNATLVDSAFAAATLASCTAQGVPAHSCPNPPSLVLAAAWTSGAGGAAQPGSAQDHDALLYAVSGAGIAAVALAVTFSVLYCRAKSARAKLVAPAARAAHGSRQPATRPGAGVQARHAPRIAWSE